MKKNGIGALVFNALVTLMSLGAFFYILKYGLGGNMSGNHLDCLVYFTVLSNIFVGLVSFAFLPCFIKNMKGKKVFIPAFMIYLKFASVTAITTTFLVATCFLSISYGLLPIIGGVNFFMHFSVPLFSLISFIFFEKYELKSSKALLAGILPVILYGTVYYIMVVELGRWKDFYGFNRGGQWYISVIVMGLFICLLSKIICLLHKRFTKDL